MGNGEHLRFTVSQNGRKYPVVGFKLSSHYKDLIRGVPVYLAYVVEFNVRFGDPECQVTLPLIRSDLYEMLHSAATGNLATYEAEFSSSHCLTVVLASEGYPGPPTKGIEITGDGVDSHGDRWVNHAGTGIQDGRLVSTGGRVLSATGIGNDLSEAAQKAYSVIGRIHLQGSHYRKDIGYRAL